MVKILHTGDLHLDSAFTGLTGDKSAQRRQGQRELLQAIVELGNDQGAQLLLLAGDLLDGQNAYYETARALGEILARSRAQVFISPGNHDPYRAASPYRSVRFPQNVHLFASERMESIPLPDLGVCVHGAAFVAQERESGLLTGFRAPEDGMIHIMVLHGEVTEGFSRYNPIREQEIAESGLQYLALGHVHSFDGIHRAGGTDYAYCGCPEGRGFDECGRKGVLIGQVTSAGAELQLHETGGYQYEVVEIPLAAEDDPLAKCLEKLPEQQPKGLYRVVLTGEHDSVDVDRILEALDSRYYFVSAVDRTVPVRSVWDGEEQDNLKGAFLRRLHRRYLDTGDLREQEKLKLAARFGVAALENREEPQ